MGAIRMHADEVPTDAALVRRLLIHQASRALTQVLAA